MSAVPPSSPSQESTIRRAHEPSRTAQATRRVAERLEQSRWLPPLALLLCAACAGLLLAPELVERSYPLDPSLLGTPVTENIKAPFEVFVTDTQTTARLQDEAVARVRRVYDMDTLLGPTAARRVEQAFALMRGHLAQAYKEADLPSEGNKLTQRQRDAERLVQQRVGRAQREALTGVLGFSLDDAVFATLLAERFARSREIMVKSVIVASMSLPIVGSSDILGPDLSNGISIQRVPNDGSPAHVLDAATVRDVANVATFARQRLVAETPNMPETLRDALEALIVPLLSPTLTLNRAETESARVEARLDVKPVTLVIKKGEMIVRDGEKLTRHHQLILGALSRGGERSSTLMVAIGAGIIVLLVIVIGFRFFGGPRRHTLIKGKDILFLTSLFGGTNGFARLWVELDSVLQERFASLPREAFLYLMPVAAATMVAKLVLRARHALLFAVVSAMTVGLIAGGGDIYILYAVVGCAVGTAVLGTISTRSDVLRGGFWVGVAQAAMAVGTLLFQANSAWSAYIVVVPLAFLSGLLASFIALATTPVVEAVFAYTTDLKLLELANFNHPALKELIVQAPGSYHHSIIVGALVEAAAEAIGANALLARVMAYYHDLGKGCNPLYFIENQRGNNPHDKIKPSMSAMVIRRHVTDGLEMARKHRLGEPIVSGILEHHGTTLIHYFYHKAKEQEEDSSPVREADYRYPGRKPQTREAALVMIADSIEAASRSLPDPAPARLRGLISRIINIKFSDGQLDECDLTLRHLHVIAKAFARVLDSIYHQRVEYPDLLKELGGGGKKYHADLDSKSTKAAAGGEPPAEKDSQDSLRRLGLS